MSHSARFILNGCASICLLSLIVSCSRHGNVFVPDQDFCAGIHRRDSIRLSDQLALLRDSMSRTGVLVLEDGDGSMVARAWLSEYAEKTIDIQYFIFSADNVGLIACDYLVRAADRGVKVRILVDDIMVEADADDLLALDSHENLDIRIYNPTTNLGKNLPGKLLSLAGDFRGFNQRMHNKTFTVDGKVAITGGRNMADEYFDYDHEYNFRDRDVLLIGGVANEVQQSFNQFWADSLSRPVSELVTDEGTHLPAKDKFEWLHQYACSPDNFWPQVREKIRQVPVAFDELNKSGKIQWVDSVMYVSDVPGKNDGSNGLGGGGNTTAALTNLIRSATKSIVIQSPYLITTEAGQRLFRDAVNRGVEVRILTNSLASTDNLEAFSGYRRDRETLLKTGVRVFEFRPDAAERYRVMTGALQKEIGFTPVFGLHAKSMVIDGEIAVIGTFNLDPRSANLNTECVTIIRSKQIAAAVLQGMEEEFKPENSWETTLESNPDSNAGMMKRLKAWTKGIIPKSIL